MKVSGLFVAVLLFFASCSSDNGNTGTGSGSSEPSDLKEQIDRLEKENAQKDSMINASLEFFNEIRSNLESIELKNEELKIRSTDPELTPDDKQWILEQIRHINYLREENARKITKLNKQLKQSGLRIKELEKMIQDLIEGIEAKDLQIAELQTELGSLDKAYSKLFDAYQEKAEVVEELKDEINACYYSYGTEEELVGNQVIERKNGFIGIGKKIKIADSFNEKYFAKIDRREDNEIFVEGSDLKFVTDHPSNSYTLVANGKNTKIRIKDPHEFWKVSKYLVIIID